MIIISYNLSWATQEDKIAGTESEFVKACKEKYSKKNNNKLSPCTQNALNLLVEFIKQHSKEQFIICIQEGTEKETPRFIDELNNETNNRFLSIKSKKMGKAYLYTIYDKTLGNPVSTQVGELTDFIFRNNKKGRPYQILQFQDFTVINAHFPHNLNLQQYQQIFAELSNNKTKYPLYFAGDFNDHNDTLLNGLVKENVKFGNKKFAKIQNNTSVPKTCCWKLFSYHSDYILTTNKKVSSSFKVLDTRIGNKNNNKVLSSDHMPVYLQTGGFNVSAKTIPTKKPKYNVPAKNIKPIQNNLKNNPFKSQSYYFNNEPVEFNNEPVEFNNNKQIKLTEGYALCKELQKNQKLLTYSTYKPVGLPNVGNTCHLNAWIQLLYRCDFYRLGIMNFNDNTNVGNRNTSQLNNFNNLFNLMPRSNNITEENMNNFVNRCQGSFSNNNQNPINYRKDRPLDYFFNYSILETFKNRPILNQLFKNNNNGNNNINRYILQLVNTNIKSNNINSIFSRYVLMQLSSGNGKKVNELPKDLNLNSSLHYNQPKKYRLLSIIVNLGNYHYVCLTRTDENLFYLINDDKIGEIYKLDKYISEEGKIAEMVCYELVD